MNAAVYHLFPNFYPKFILKATSKFEIDSVIVCHQFEDLVLDYNFYSHNLNDKSGIHFQFDIYELNHNDQVIPVPLCMRSHLIIFRKIMIRPFILL